MTRCQETRWKGKWAREGKGGARVSGTRLSVIQRGKQGYRFLTQVFSGSSRSKRMATTEPRYSKEEFARRGDAIYEKDSLPQLTARDVGKFLAIDIETGQYEIASDEMKAGSKLRLLPEAQIWMVRIGYTSTRGFGGRQSRQDLP